MRSDQPVPETPEFWAELEAELRAEARSRRRRRAPVATTALRALRTVSGAAVHVLAASMVAAVVLLAVPLPNQAPVEAPIPDPRAIETADQDAAASSWQAMANLAESQGFEVTVDYSYTVDHRAHGQVLEIRHLGTSRADLPPPTGVKGPLVIVVGLAVSDGAVVAT